MDTGRVEGLVVSARQCYVETWQEQAAAAQSIRLRSTSHDRVQLKRICWRWRHIAEFLLLSVPSQVTAEEQSVMRGAIENLRTYGHRAGPEEPVELVNLRVVARAESEGERIAAVAAPQAKGLGDSRQAYFGKAGWCDTPILGRGDLVSDVAGLVGAPRRPR
jgi:hypothetical protein